MASVIKFLVSKCDMSPLDIFTEKKVKTPIGNTFIDVFWDGKYLECITHNTGIEGRKLKDLLTLNAPLYIAMPHDVEMKSISSQLIPRIKGVYLFDIEKEELFKAFKTFDEFLAYVMLRKSLKTINIDL